MLCVPEVKKAFDTMSSSASTAAGDLSDVECTSRSACRADGFLPPATLSTKPTMLCVPEVKKAFDTMSSSASTAAGDLSDVETLSPAGNSTFGADESWLVDHSPQVVVRSTFLDVEEVPSLSERFRRLRRAFTEPHVDSGTELYEPGKFSDDAAESDPESEDSQMCVPVIQVRSVDEESTELVEPRLDLPMMASVPKDEKNQEQGKTTVMLRNLPNNYTRSMLLNLLEKQGFVGRFDFLYLPCDFQRKANLGYAFVNMVNCQAVEDLWKTFDGFKGWALPSAKVCEVRWSGPHQGLEAHVERYRNSPVMHKSVPDEYRPVIFVDGQRQRFPAPTKFIKPPQAQSRR